MSLNVPTFNNLEYSTAYNAREKDMNSNFHEEEKDFSL
jgi:hypothetical protein